jgi:radical SAM protein with 4Fe4S-binding SPASM domain
MLKYTDLKKTDRQTLRDVMPLAKPFTVLVEPSSMCNFRCIQCFQSLKEPSYFSRNRMHMPMERFERVMGQLKAWPGERHKVLKLAIYGEPLMTPDFCAMLGAARAADVAERIETTTNASVLTRAIAESLVEHQMDYLRVSIYALDDQTFKAVTGSPLAHRTVHDNLSVLQEVKKARGSERPFVSCKMLDSYREEENQRFLSMFRGVADEAYVDEPHGWVATEGADFIGRYYEDGAAEVKRDLERKSTPRVACPMPFTTIAVRSNGDVAPCCVDYVGGTNLGNVETSTLEDMWNSARWIEFQKMQLQGRNHENSSCASCEVYKSNHYTRDDIDGFPVERLRKPRKA